MKTDRTTDFTSCAPQVFEIALVHATIAEQLAKFRHESRCSKFHNSDVIAKRVDANLADLGSLLEQAHEQCSILSPLHEHSMFARAVDRHPHNCWHVSFVVCSRCRLELRDVGHCVLEPVGPTCIGESSVSRLVALFRARRARDQVPQRCLSLLGSTGVSWRPLSWDSFATVLQECCCRFVMVSTQSFHDTCDIPSWTTSSWKAAVTTRPCEHGTSCMLVEGCPENSLTTHDNSSGVPTARGLDMDSQIAKSGNTEVESCT